MSASLLLVNAGAVFGMMTLLWLVSVARADASIVDPWWSIGFLVVTLNTIARTGVTPAKLLLAGMVGLWALRLWLHLLRRGHGKPEDPRYAAFRERYGRHRYWWVSYFQVFLLQGALVLVISAPLQLAAAWSHTIGLTQALGGLVFAVGFLFEALADHQLEAFKRDASRRGQVLDEGLWRWSRHPNYFGDALLWWGFWLFAVDLPFGWATIVAPALMTFLLVRVSGVAMLDAHLGRTKPGYADYIRRTSAFIPRRKRPAVDGPGQ